VFGVVRGSENKDDQSRTGILAGSCVDERKNRLNKDNVLERKSGN
jgi:hypothetical protein